jgi:5'-nucleotidase
VILVTSDDGMDSPGLTALARAVTGAGLAHVVAGNDRGWTSAGTSLGVPDGAQSVVRTGDRAYLFRGAPPALMVTAACDGLLGAAPDAVVVGVNHGPNVGRTALHSGTVGAALTALAFGLPAVAVSCDDVYSTGGDEDGEMHLDHAAVLAVELLAPLLGGPARALNLNVPNLPAEDVGRPRPARPARTFPTVTAGPDGRLAAGVRVTGPDPDGEDDVTLLRAGHPTSTELRPLFDGVGVHPPAARPIPTPPRDTSDREAI